MEYPHINNSKYTPYANSCSTYQKTIEYPFAGKKQLTCTDFKVVQVYV